jgi:hypothetical protein
MTRPRPNYGKEIPEGPVFGAWYYLSFKKYFFEGSTRYQMQLQNFSKIFMFKNKVLGPVQVPKKTFFEFFCSISKGLSTGPKGEQLNFYYSNILNPPLVLNPKSTTFSPLGLVQSPLGIEEKNLKISFF